jgi:hypothetical protein
MRDMSYRITRCGSDGNRLVVESRPSAQRSHLTIRKSDFANFEDVPFAYGI